MALQKLYQRQERSAIDHSERRDRKRSGCGSQHPAWDLELGGRKRDGVEVVRMSRDDDYRQLFCVVGVEGVVDDDGLRSDRGILRGPS